LVCPPPTDLGEAGLESTDRESGTFCDDECEQARASQSSCDHRELTSRLRYKPRSDLLTALVALGWFSLPQFSESGRRGGRVRLVVAYGIVGYVWLWGLHTIEANVRRQGRLAGGFPRNGWLGNWTVILFSAPSFFWSVVLQLSASCSPSMRSEWV